MNRQIIQSRPQWVERMDFLNRQPDLLDVVKEALPFVEGVMALTEKTSDIDAYENTKVVFDRLRGAIAKEEAKAAGFIYPFRHTPMVVDENGQLKPKGEITCPMPKT